MYRLRVLALIASWAAVSCGGAPRGASPGRAAPAPPASGDSPACLSGAYRSADGGAMALVASATDARALRFVDLDGRGAMFHASGPRELTAGPGLSGDAPIVSYLRHGACADREVRLGFEGGAERVWTRIPITRTATRFDSAGTVLAGELIEPADAAPSALVVHVHRSEKTGAVGHNYHSLLLATQGLASFVYDKRGTGSSQGTYTQHFTQLAGDAASAAAEARRLTRGRYPKTGFFGGSQGGWVAPLAARIAASAGAKGADFVVVGFGMVDSPLGEDAEQVKDELRRKGYGDDVLAKAREVTDATGAVVASHVTSGFEGIAAVRRRYENEPWFSVIRGEYTGDVLRTPEGELRVHGAERFDDLQIEWRYDAVATLRAVAAPSLWILGAEDIEAPSSASIVRLKSLQAEGRPIDLSIFPHADHGIREFVTESNGERRYTRFSSGYFRLIAEWIQGAAKPPYGDAAWLPAKPGAAAAR